MKELAHLGAAAEFGDEVVVEPRLVDAQVGVHQQAVAIETLDVVALVGAAVAPHVDTVLVHRPDQQGAGNGPPERGGVEVGPPRRGDVERTTLKRYEALVHQLGAAVHQACFLGAVLLRPTGHTWQVGLIVLAEIGGVAVGDGALFAHPRHSGRGVETSAKRDTDPFTDGERREHLGHVA